VQIGKAEPNDFDVKSRLFMEVVVYHTSTKPNCQLTKLSGTADLSANAFFYTSRVVEQATENFQIRSPIIRP